MKQRTILFSIIILLCTATFAQSASDSVYQRAIKVFNKSKVAKTINGEYEVEKCGLGLIASLQQYQAEISQKYGNEILSVLQRPVKQATYNTPSGFFKIHYDTIGTDAVNYNIVQFSEYLEIAYTKEVGEMGFPAPVRDNGAGGDNRYDIYIENLGATYGFTVPDGVISASAKTVYTFIKIHNNFNNFYTKGLEAARVTAAHELHHAIQMSNYTYKDGNGIEDLFFYEMTATSMEEFVFDEVNDYINYLRSFYRNPQLSMVHHSGYDLAHWNLFLKAKFDIDLIKRQWYFFKSSKAMTAIENAIAEKGRSFKSLFREFGIWCFYTGFLAQNNKFFKDAEKFPTYEPTVLRLYSGSFVSDTVQVSPASISILKYIMPGSSTQDTITLIVGNGNALQADADSRIYEKFYAKVSLNALPNANCLAGKYYVFCSSFQSNYLFFETIFNNVASGWNISSQVLYPNPYLLKSHDNVPINIPISESDSEQEGDLIIYNSAMQMVFSGKKSILLYVMKWFPSESKIGDIGSGVYFYIIKTKKNSYTGKFTIING